MTEKTRVKKGKETWPESAGDGEGVGGQIHLLLWPELLISRARGSCERDPYLGEDCRR